MRWRLAGKKCAARCRILAFDASHFEDEGWGDFVGLRGGGKARVFRRFLEINRGFLRVEIEPIGGKVIR